MKRISVMAGLTLPRLIGLRLSGLISAESHRPGELWPCVGHYSAPSSLHRCGSNRSGRDTNGQIEIAPQTPRFTCGSEMRLLQPLRPRALRQRPI
jgi:hypothetical protein